MYSPFKAVWWIPKLILISYKKCLLLKFLLFRMKYIINGGCLFHE